MSGFILQLHARCQGLFWGVGSRHSGCSFCDRVKIKGQLAAMRYGERLRNGAPSPGAIIAIMYGYCRKIEAPDLQIKGNILDIAITGTTISGPV